MAWPYLTGVIKVVVEITLDGKLMVNIHFAQKQGGLSLDPSDNVNVADAVYQAYTTNWALQASNEAQITQVSAIGWETPGDRIGFTTGILPFGGADVNDALPNNCAIVVTNRSNFVGRSKRGRTYYPGIHEASVGNNDIGAGSLAQILATSVAIGSGLDAEGFDHVVYSLYTAGAPRATPLATKISAYEANSRVDTQRRRMPTS